MPPKTPAQQNSFRVVLVFCRLRNRLQKSQDKIRAIRFCPKATKYVFGCTKELVCNGIVSESRTFCIFRRKLPQITSPKMMQITLRQQFYASHHCQVGGTSNSANSSNSSNSSKSLNSSNSSNSSFVF